jgi:aspartate carbamoyltransferase catalytic subunit
MDARRILRIDDLTDHDIDLVLARAGRYTDGKRPVRSSAIVGLAFFETSLRTRVGFSAAAHRIGADVIEVSERRASEISMPESLSDTVRTISGYVDALVVRVDRPSAELAAVARPDVSWFNAGDRGDKAEHPSQALLDLFAIERMLGPISGQRIALCGDLRSRAARSLLALLARRRPEAVALVTDPSLLPGFQLPATLEEITSTCEPGNLGDATVVYAVGIPHGGATEAVRSRLRVDQHLLEHLSKSCIVLSPMPIIDEIATPARRDPRMRYFEQSDLAIGVRMALLELLLGRLA